MMTILSKGGMSYIELPKQYGLIWYVVDTGSCSVLIN